MPITHPTVCGLRVVTCDATIVDENEFASSRCKDDAAVGRSCRSDCEDGYTGGSSVYECTAAGLYEIQEGSGSCSPKDCGATIPSLPENSSANCTADSSFNLYETATCEASCDAGYVISGDATYECGTSGKWEAVEGFECAPVSCGETIPGLSPHATANCAVDPVFGGEDCIATCDEGFVATSGTGVYTCGADGKWNGALACAPVDCGAAGPAIAAPGNANGIEILGGQCGGQTFFGGDKCSLKCAAGYQPVPRPDGSINPLFTCDVDGQWAGSFTCEKISCGAFAPNFLHDLQGCTEGTLFQSVCSLACPAGFGLASSTPPTYTCGADGMWRGTPIVCERVDCGPLAAKAPAATVVTSSTCDTTYESVCNLACAPGFSAEFGSPSYTCAADGEWAGLLVCGRIKCQPLDLDGMGVNSNVELVRPCESSLFEDVCKARCIAGYEPATGSDEFTCTADGTWSGQYACQRKDCGSEIPYDTLGDYAQASCGDTTLFGDLCSATCETGYELVNLETGIAGQFTCTDAGAWAGYTNCQPVNCGSTVPSPGPKVTGTCFGDTRYTGTPCQLRCEEGYHLAGGSTGLFTCSDQGEWTGEAICEPNECPVGDLPATITDPNAAISCPPTAPGEETTFNLYDGPGCTATCNSGYQPILGDGAIVCNADTTWSGVLECGPIDCAPIEGLVDATANCADFEFKSTCQATCNPGYNQVPQGGSGEFTCGADKRFTGSILCEPLDCPGSVPGLADATSDCAETKFGGAPCEARCDDGFLGGSSLFTCGTDGAWVGSLQCFRKDCGALVPVSTQGNFLRSNCPDSLFQDTCDVFCAPGYDLMVEQEVVGSGGGFSGAGEPATDIEYAPAESVTFTCGADAFWSAPQAMCVPISCGPLVTGSPLLENQVASCTTDDETLFDGSGCEVQCAPNYKRASGATLYTCGTAGEWVGNLECVPVDCGSTVLNLERKNAVSAACTDTEFGDYCQVSCRAGTETSSGINTADFICNGNNGLWEGVIMCAPKDCGAVLPRPAPIPAVPGAHWADTPSYLAGECIGDTRFEGDNCVVECAEGYTMTQGNGVFICNEEGVWAGTGVCSPVNCGEMLIPFDDKTGSSSLNTVHSCSNPVFDGAPCTATCKQGYEVVGGSDDSATYTCGADGLWTAQEDDFACTPVTCPAEGPALDRYAEADCTGLNVFDHPEACKASCKPGYEPVSGDGVYVCGADGEWAGGLVCRPKNCGSDITTIDSASTAHRVCVNSDYRGVCIAYCRAGYTAVGGSPLFRCGTEGAWEGELVCERNTCPPLPVSAPENTAGQCNGKRTAGSTCKLSCGAGFLAVGAGEYTCNDQGIWEGGCGFACVDAGVWTKFEDNLYHVDLQRLNMGAAQMHCREEDADLVTITSVAENSFVYDLSREATTDTIAMWTSLKLIRTSTPQVDTFDYVGAGNQLVTYASSLAAGLWANKEPNDYRGGEDCVAVGYYDDRRKLPDKWNDISCDEEYAFVCERSARAECTAAETGVGGFFVALTSLGVGDPAGQRFSTALEPQHIIAHIDYTGKGNGRDIGAVTWACRDECADTAECVGFFLQQKGGDLSCNLLNNLGVSTRT